MFYVIIMNMIQLNVVIEKYQLYVIVGILKMVFFLKHLHIFLESLIPMKTGEIEDIYENEFAMYGLCGLINPNFKARCSFEDREYIETLLKAMCEIKDYKPFLELLTSVCRGKIPFQKKKWTGWNSLMGTQYHEFAEFAAKLTSLNGMNMEMLLSSVNHGEHGKYIDKFCFLNKR
eukprot:85743_1